MDKALWDKGLAVRKKTLGAEYVAKSLTTVDDVNKDWQDMLNEFCWGKVWGDDTIPAKTREGSPEPPPFSRKRRRTSCIGGGRQV